MELTIGVFNMMKKVTYQIKTRIRHFMLTSIPKCSIGTLDVFMKYFTENKILAQDK